MKTSIGRGLVKALLIMSVPAGQVACDEQRRLAHTIALRDSAGVAIFEAPVDARMVGTWTVSKSPELSIGEGQDGELLYEVTAGRQFADGAFVIANQGSYQLLFYSHEGVLERSVGRQGSGPNEFRSLDVLEVIADSVWVYDVVNQRISVLDRTGEFLRLIPLVTVSHAGPARVVGVFGDGSILLLGHEPGITWPPEPGLRPAYRRALVLNPDGTISDLGRFFRGESYWVPAGGNIYDVGRPFGREAFTDVHGTEWFYTAGAEYRVERYDMHGRLRGVYSYPGEPRSVTQDDLDAYLERFRAEVGRPTLREQLLRKSPLPERMPAYAGLMIDGEGNVWAAPCAAAEPPRCWHVYQRWSPQFAKVCLPDHFTALDIAGGSVLGVLRDENDVERIVRYRLVR